MFCLLSRFNHYDHYAQSVFHIPIMPSDIDYILFVIEVGMCSLYLKQVLLSILKLPDSQFENLIRLYCRQLCTLATKHYVINVLKNSTPLPENHISITYINMSKRCLSLYRDAKEDVLIFTHFGWEDCW